MAPSKKVTQACKALKEFGISANKVKAAVKELLNVYDNQWVHIEDDNYRVVLDFILENKPEENELLKNKRKAPCSTVESKEKSKKKVAPNRGKIEVNKPPTKRLRKCSKITEPEAPITSSRAAQLLEAKLSTGSVALSEPDECEPSRKTLWPTHHIEQALVLYDIAVTVEDTNLLEVHPLSTEYDDSKTNMLLDTTNLSESGGFDLVRKRPRRNWEQEGEAERSRTEKVEELSDLCIDGEQTKPLSVYSSQKSKNDEKKSFHTIGENCVSSQKKSRTLDISITPDEEKVYTRRKKCVTAKDPWADHLFNPSAADNVLDMYHNPMNYLHGQPCFCCELHSPCNQYYEEEFPCRNCSKVQKDNSKFLHCEVSHKEAKVSRGTSTSEANFDIASSLKKEVKISLIYDSSQQPNCRAPSLDDFLKVVDDKCCESYKVTTPDFTEKLMVEICQCFLEMGNDPVNNQPTKASIVPSCRNLDLGVHLSVKSDLQCELSIESVNIRNLFKLVSGIPRLPFLAWLDNIHYFVSSGINYIGHVLLDHKRIKLIENMEAIETNHSSLVARSIEYVVEIVLGEGSLKISFANGSCAEFFYAPCNLVCKKASVKIVPFHTTDADSCLKFAMDCLSLQIPCVLTHKTCGKPSCMLEIMVNKDFLEEWLLMNQDTEEWHFLCRKKHQPPCRMNRKILNLHSCCLTRFFVMEQWFKCCCCERHGNMVPRGGIPVNLQIGNPETALKGAEGSNWLSFQH